MTHNTCETYNLSKDFGLTCFIPTYAHVLENLSTICISGNLTFHKRTIHVEVDYHFIWEVVISKQISIPFIKSSHQLADIFLKAYPLAWFLIIRNKLSMTNIYSPALVGVLGFLLYLALSYWRVFILYLIGLSYLR